MTDAEGVRLPMDEQRVARAGFGWYQPERDGPVHVIMPDGSERQSAPCDLEMMELLELAQISSNGEIFLERIRNRCEW